MNTTDPIIRVAGVLLLAALAAAALWWFFVRKPEKPVGIGGSYEDVKRRIRSGEAASVPDAKPRRREPPKTLDAIFAMEDTDAFFSALVERAGDAEDRLGWLGLRDGDRIVLLVFWLTGEVFNGGFDQWFFNSSGDHAQEVPMALRAIGATESLAIVERALTVFPNSRPDPDRERRWKQSDAWTEQQEKLLDTLDHEFWDLKEEWNALVVAWARRNREKFS